MAGEKFYYVSEMDIEAMITKAVSKVAHTRLYSIAEAAIMLDTTERDVRDRKQEIGFVKYGKFPKFRGEDLQAFIDRNYVRSISA